jgi:transposase
MADRSFGRVWQASTRLDTPPCSASHHPNSAIALLVRQRTQRVNAVRGHAAEFGIIAAKGIAQVEPLLDKP